ncbi:MAG: hypothetical protein ACHP6I_01600 [Rickettsiales bacterium]
MPIVPIILAEKAVEAVIPVVEHIATSHAAETIIAAGEHLAAEGAKEVLAGAESLFHSGVAQEAIKAAPTAAENALHSAENLANSKQTQNIIAEAKDYVTSALGHVEEFVHSSKSSEILTEAENAASSAFHSIENTVQHLFTKTNIDAAINITETDLLPIADELANNNTNTSSQLIADISTIENMSNDTAKTAATIGIITTISNFLHRFPEAYTNIGNDIKSDVAHWHSIKTELTQMWDNGQSGSALMKGTVEFLSHSLNMITHHFLTPVGHLAFGNTSSVTNTTIASNDTEIALNTTNITLASNDTNITDPTPPLVETINTTEA